MSPATPEPVTYTQGRIRLRQSGAPVLLDALTRHEAFLADVKELIVGKDDRLHLNTDLRELRRIIEEVERTIEERGWDDDQPQSADPR